MAPAKKTRQIRVDDDVADMAEELATLLRQTTPNFLSALLRPILKKQLQHEMERRMKELRGGKDQPPA